MSSPNDAVFLVPQANIDAYDAYQASKHSTVHSNSSTSSSSSRHTSGLSKARQHAKTTKAATLPHKARSHGSDLPAGVEDQRF